MKLLDLFSGIGGFSLAASWLGWETVQFVEWDSFCQKVLKHHWPNVPIHSDIKTFNAEHLHGAIDIISGGFPCQPFSHAGKRKGTADDRYLWPEMLRVIREVKPSFIVGENVAGLVSMENGKTLDRILSDLANEGYKTEQFIIPACSVGAWHRRDRIWVIAYSDKIRLQKTFKRYGQVIQLPATAPNNFSRFNANQWVIVKRNHGELRSDNGIPNWMDRISGLGNAIVPQVAYQIFKAIDEYR